MSPMKCIERLKSVEATLGAEGFNQFKFQLDKVENSVCCMDTRNMEHLFTISAAHVTAIYLRQLHYSYPDHPISDWPLQHQMEAVYAFLACELDFPFDSFNVNTATDLEIKTAAEEFTRYPIAREA